MRVPALIFDYGNVVAFFDYKIAFGRIGAPFGLSAEEILRRLDEGGFSQQLVEFESGRMDARAFAQRLTAAAGVALSYEEFVRAWEDIFALNESVARLIAALDRSGYTLILGSNTNILHTTHFRRKFAGTLDRFDALVFSYEVGYYKPERGFYEACAAAADVPAASCVFIDDLIENVKGARLAGLEALQYTGTPALVAALRGLGVEISPGE
jgi:putative hydrolase of the HAD superfamily